MLSDVAGEGLIANAYNQINTTYTTTLIPDQAQKFNSGIKSSMVVMKLTIYLCLLEIHKWWGRATYWEEHHWV
jgi:hypothetical protein